MRYRSESPARGHEQSVTLQTFLVRRETNGIQPTIQLTKDLSL
jgi:hypothetical protein